jgi:hypothetical protein
MIWLSVNFNFLLFIHKSNRNLYFNVAYSTGKSTKRLTLAREVGDQLDFDLSKANLLYGSTVSGQTCSVLTFTDHP